MSDYKRMNKAALIRALSERDGQIETMRGVALAAPAAAPAAATNDLEFLAHIKIHFPGMNARAAFVAYLHEQFPATAGHIPIAVLLDQVELEVEAEYVAAHAPAVSECMKCGALMGGSEANQPVVLTLCAKCAAPAGPGVRSALRAICDWEKAGSILSGEKDGHYFGALVELIDAAQLALDREPDGGELARSPV